MAPKLRIFYIFDSVANLVVKKKLLSKYQVWYPGLYYTSSRVLYFILFALLHYIPAFFADIFLRFSSHKIRFLRVYKKIYQLQNVLSPFVLIEYKFSDQNVMDLIARQNDCDKSLFNMNLADLKLDQYFEDCIRGFIKYLLDEPAKPNLDSWRRVFVLRYGFITIMTVVMFYIVVHVLNYIF